MPEVIISPVESRRQEFRRMLRSDTLRAGFGRAVMLPLGAVAIYLTTRLTVEAVGGRDYGPVALLVTLPYLIPISDLGLGGAVTSHIGRHGWQRRTSLALVRHALGLLCAVASALVALGAVLAASGNLARMLGISFDHANAVAFAVVVVFAATIPLGIGARVLIGLEQQAIATTVQALSPVFALAAFLLTTTFGTTLASAVIALSLGPLLASATQCAVALVQIRRAPSGRRPHPGGTVPSLRSIVGAAAPFTIMSSAIPLAYQSDRVILAHVGTADALAQYSVVGTVYGSLVGVVGATGTSLWPYFQRLHSTGADLAAAFRRSSLLLAGSGATLAAGLLVLGQWVVRLISAQQIAPGYGVFACFAALLVAIAVQYPISMLLIAYDDLWYCAACSVTMLVFNVPLAVLLVRLLGAPGPAAASAITTATLLVVPLWVKARRRLAPAARRPARHRRSRATHPSDLQTDRPARAGAARSK